MLVLDGFFIVELIRKYRFDEQREDDDTIFQYEQLLGRLRHDLMLIENQIPFFVIDQLFTLTKCGYPNEDILYLIHRFFEDVSRWPEASELGAKISTNNADHLFGLVNNIWCSSFAKMTGKKPVKRKKEKIMAITSTAELQESGIEFEKEAESNGIDIKFIGGVMKIPDFCILDETESIFKNLMAYEHFFIDNHPKFMTDYVYFLHCLINSAVDVEILRRRGIVTNFLGDDEMACRTFNRLGRNINVSSNFCYANVYDQANGKCGKQRSRWMVILRRDYFNNPWSLLKIFAALLMLLFALTQTVYTVLSYVKPK